MYRRRTILRMLFADSGAEARETIDGGENIDNEDVLSIMSTSVVQLPLCCELSSPTTDKLPSSGPSGRKCETKVLLVEKSVTCSLVVDNGHDACDVRGRYCV